VRGRSAEGTILGEGVLPLAVIEEAVPRLRRVIVKKLLLIKQLKLKGA
jgi:hypothetical protein